MGLAKKTKAAAPWLLLLVAIVHLGYEPLAAWAYPHAPVAAGKAFFYILRGVEGAVLWLAVLALASDRRPTLVVACAWGAVESAQSAACRLALPIGGSSPVAPSWGGMCDLVAGVPVAGLTAAVALLALSIVQESTDAAKEG